MANNENLLKGKATQFVAGEAQAEIASKGGTAKAEKAKLRKTFAELGKAMVDSPITADQIEDVRCEFPGLSLEEITNRALMLQAQIDKAIKGDQRAFELVRDTIGEKPVDKQDVTHSGNLVANYSVCSATVAAAKKAKQNRVKIDE